MRLNEESESGKFLKSLDGETKVIMEHTGRYYESIAQVIHEQGVFVSAVKRKTTRPAPCVP